MRPETAFAEFYSKLVCSTEQALSGGSPRHAVMLESKPIIHALQGYFDKEGWGTEILETGAEDSKDYFGVLIIRRPADMPVKSLPQGLEFPKIKRG